MDNNLKPCPFCGSGVNLGATRGTADGPGKIVVTCSVCQVSFMGLAGANHLWSSPSDRAYVADVIAAWNTRCTH